MTVKRYKKLRSDNKRLKKEKIDFWSERIELQESRTIDVENISGISERAIEYQKELAKKLQMTRLEYIEKHHKEPDFTEFEYGLIVKYC